MENCENKFWSSVLAVFFYVWRAIPAVHDRQLSFAQLAEKWGCAPLLTTKYKPFPVGSDRVISA